MADSINVSKRSENMSRIRQKDTVPEMRVRRSLHAMGYRYRLHRKDLPGSPDIVFPRQKKAIFVHGCFWHRHHGCRLTYTPKSNIEFWTKKFAVNQARDARAVAGLKTAGWAVLVVWECESGDKSLLDDKLTRFLRAA